MQKIMNMLSTLRKLLTSWLWEIKQLSTERWNSWKQKRANHKAPLSVVEALEAVITSKNEFIVYLQDEVAELKAQLKQEPVERVRNEVDFQSSRGYRSVHARVREQVLFNKRKSLVVAEDQYEKVEVND